MDRPSFAYVTYPILVSIAVVAAFLAILAFGGLETAIGAGLPLERTALYAGLAAAFSGGYAWLMARRGNRPFRLGAGCAVLGAVIVTVTLSRTALLYETTSVQFLSSGATLSGEVYLPKSMLRVPGVVLVAGSGRETREATEFYAKFLARRGIAALAYDKRGTGESTGKLYETDFVGYAKDAAAAYATLKEFPGVHPSRVGFWGFSEAEWVAPLAMKEVGDAAFLVVVGASALSPAGQVWEEIDLRLQRKGFGKAEREKAASLWERVAAYQRTGEGREALHQQLAAAQSEPWFAAAEDFPEETVSPDEYRWWRSVMDVDTRPLLRELSAPMLFLKGSGDDRSDAGRTRQRLIEAVGPAGRQRTSIEMLSGADHLLLRWPLGGRIPPPAFASAYPDLVTTFIMEKTEKLTGK